MLSSKKVLNIIKRRRNVLIFGMPCAILGFSFALYLLAASNVMYIPVISSEKVYAQPLVRAHIERDLRTRFGAVALAWSPGDAKLAVAADYGDTLSIWNSAGVKEVEIRHLGGGPILTRSLSFLSDQSHLLFTPGRSTEDQDALVVYDVGSGNVAMHIPVSPNDFGRSRGFSLNNKESILASIGSSRPNSYNNVYIYSGKTLEARNSVPIDGIVWSVSVCADGKTTVVGTSNGEVLLFASDTGQKTKTIKPFAERSLEYGAVQAVACSPHGDLIFAGAGDTNLAARGAERLSSADNVSSGPVTVRRVQDNELVASIHDVHPPIWQAAWDPEDRYVAFVDSSGFLYILQIHPKASGYLRLNLGGGGYALAISSDGSKIAGTMSGGVRIYSINSVQ
jgi:WD40 repeat protein